MARTTATPGVTLVGPDNGRDGFLGSIGVRFMIDGADAGVAAAHGMDPGRGESPAEIDRDADRRHMAGSDARRYPRHIRFHP